jgi:hypothetical protein
MIIGVIQAFSWMGWGNSRNISAKIGGSWAEILVTVWVNLLSEIRNIFSTEVWEHFGIRNVQQPRLIGRRKIIIWRRYETGCLVKFLGYGTWVKGLCLDRDHCWRRHETGCLVKFLGYGTRVQGLCLDRDHCLFLPPGTSLAYFALLSWVAQSVQWLGYGLDE